MGLAAGADNLITLAKTYTGKYQSTMSTIEATLRNYLSFQEKFTAAEMPASRNRSITNDQFNQTKTLKASTTPAATKGWAGEKTGTQTLDLTALTRTVCPTVDASGLKLQAMQIVNLSTTATLSIAKGASNGYAINGASGNYVIPPSGSLLVYFAGGLGAVGPTAKTIDCTVTPAGSGTEVQDFTVSLIFG